MEWSLEVLVQELLYIPTAKGHSPLGDPKLKMGAGHSSFPEVILLFSPQPALVPHSAASLMR